MNLTSDDRWILTYLKEKAQFWDDVKFGAVRAISKIEKRKDLVDWVDYFLPKQRIQELKRDLSQHKSKATVESDKTNSHVNIGNLVSVQLSADAVNRLKLKAQKEQCSSSELILKYIA